MRRWLQFIYITVAGLWLFSLSLSAAVISMESGERLIGQITEKSDSTTVVLQSALLGEISLPRDQISGIESTRPTNTPKPAVTADNGAPAAASTESAEAGPKPSNKSLLQKVRELSAPDDWEGNLQLGLSLSRGDRRWAESFAKGNLVIDPKQSPNYYRYAGSYTLRETEKSDGTEVVSTDRYDANFTFRRDFSERWFFQNSLAGRVDRIKGIDRELQESVGVGYRIRPSEKIELLVGGGGGVEDLRTEFEDTRTGLNPIASIFQELTWQPLEKVRLTQEFNYFVNPEEAEQYNYILRASLRYRLTDLLGLELSFNKNFDNDVGDGNQRDDTRLRNAVIVYF